MYSRLRHGLVAAVVTAGVLASVAGVAVAAGPPVTGGPAGSGVCAGQAAGAASGGTIATLRAFADCEIGRRVTTLGQLSAAVNASKGLTSADASALTADITAAGSGLATLRSTIDGQTTALGLRAEIVEIVARFRVYELLVPQVRLTVAADDELALQADFDKISTNLAGRISTAGTAGTDAGAAQAALDAMTAAAAAGAGLAAPLPAQLLALTPAQFDSGGAARALQNARAAVIKAREDFAAAAQDARNVLAALK